MPQNPEKPSVTEPRDYVAEMTILTQVIEKENKHNVLYENYNINPATTEFITDKPNIDPSKYTFAKKNLNVSDDKDINLSSTLQRFRAVPKEKQKYPLTDSQKIGWFHNAKQIQSFEKLNRQNNSELAFDNAYWKVKGYSQFSNKVSHG